MDWMQSIDAYCERTGPQFWAEPVNALTNLAFVIAAFAAFRVWRRGARPVRARHHRTDGASLALIILVAIIGIGSFLFHTFAVAWASLADILPIAIFIYAYFALALHRFFALRGAVTVLVTLGFLGLSLVAEPLLRPLAGGSAAYLPALAALFAIGGVMRARGHRQAGLVLGAGAVFTVSLAARMADVPFCAAWPLGTHFLWHILNATTLGLLLVAAVREGAHTPHRRITA